MATSISGKAGAVFDLSYHLAVELSEDLRAHLKIEASRWSYGDKAGEVNVVYADTITLTQPNTGGETNTLNLKDGLDKDSVKLLDVFKQALTMTAIKFLYIKNNSDEATLLVGGGESFDLDIFSAGDVSAKTDILKIKPLSSAILLNDPSVAGVSVATNYNLKLLLVAAGDKTMDVDVIALGLD